ERGRICNVPIATQFTPSWTAATGAQERSKLLNGPRMQKPIAVSSERRRLPLNPRHYLVRDSCSDCVATSLMEPTHGVANVSDTGPEIEVALAVAVLVAVRAQVDDPYAAKAPAGRVTVNVSCAPASVPDGVPLIGVGPPAGVMATVPVTAVPVCVSAAVIAVVRLGRVSLPDPLPAT